MKPTIYLMKDIQYYSKFELNGANNQQDILNEPRLGSFTLHRGQQYSVRLLFFFISFEKEAPHCDCQMPR